MKTQEIFDLAIKIGMKNDPRGKSGVIEVLRQNKKNYHELSKSKQLEYDKEKFINPYSDSRFLCGDKKAKVKRVMVGIDIGAEEILLAKELERQGKKIDLIIAHHPEGRALADLCEVMDIQTAVLFKAGLPENIGEGVLKDRLGQVSRSTAPINHYKSVMAAEIIGIPMICVHTPADNCVWKLVNDHIEKKKPKTVGEILEKLKEIPEYKKAVDLHAGPRVFAGEEESRAGKIVVSGMTGGTSGSEKVYERMSHFGIGTEIAMHIREEDRDEAIKHYINVVIAGHMASDSLGLNIIMDELEKKGIEIIPCSGYIRYSRNKK
jgi:putative NIF3 family GTP cyclohydrolase 1 type 2